MAEVGYALTGFRCGIESVDFVNFCIARLTQLHIGMVLTVFNLMIHRLLERLNGFRMFA